MTEAQTESTSSPHLHPGSDETAAVIDELESVAETTGYGINSVFTDWVDLSLLAFERNDPDYLAIVDRYQDEYGEEVGRSCLRGHARALGELAVVTGRHGHDVIGLVYAQLGMQSDAFGQHFTPHTVSDAMAEMIVSPADIDEVDPPFRVHDPACGSGRLLLSAARVVERIDEAPPSLFYGRDKSPTCAKMTALNLALNQVPGVAIHGDSITRDDQTFWKVVPDGTPVVERNPDVDVAGDGAQLRLDDATGDTDA